MERVVNGIVIKSVPYRDNDRILTVFTAEEGLVTAKLTGVQKAGAKLKFAKDPFSFCEFVLTGTGDKNTVISATLLDGFFSIGENLYAYYAGCVILEFLGKFYPEGLTGGETFVLAVKALSALVNEKKNPYSVLAHFLVGALSESGFSLELRGCQGCGKTDFERVFFEGEDGAFFCEDCRTPSAVEMTKETYDFLLKAETSDSFLVGADGGKKLMRFFSYYLSLRVGENLKTLSDFLTL